MDIEALRWSPQSRGPLGPLTPQPLTPSVFPVVDDKQGIQPTAEKKLNWDNLDKLPDMQSVYVSSPIQSGHKEAVRLEIDSPASFGSQPSLSPGISVPSSKSTTSSVVGSTTCHNPPSSSEARPEAVALTATVA